MTVTVKKEAPLIVPAAVQRRAGLTAGDKLEFRAGRGVITIRAKRPSSVDEYTPEQRREIDARLAAARRTRTHGPFTAAQAAEFLKSEITARRRKSPRKSSDR